MHVVHGKIVDTLRPIGVGHLSLSKPFGLYEKSAAALDLKYVFARFEQLRNRIGSIIHAVGEMVMAGVGRVCQMAGTNPAHQALFR